VCVWGGGGGGGRGYEGVWSREGDAVQKITGYISDAQTTSIDGSTEKTPVLGVYGCVSMRCPQGEGEGATLGR